MTGSSPFLQSNFRSQANTLAIVHLSRDNLVPVILKEPSAATDGYAEGAVLTSRFGSFPHTTLTNVPWGSQIRASAVDTGSRGRKKKVTAPDATSDPASESLSDLKRKRDGTEEATTEANDPKRRRSLDGEAAENGGEVAVKMEVDEPPTIKVAADGATPDAPAVMKSMPSRSATQSEKESVDSPAVTAVQPAVTASSGFLHILKPSPELWTISLPHRTQVVYTPDYSYVLQRIRALPGKTLIEAGSGSGSFTHASARAVYNGYPSGPEDKKGKVYSFEYHPQRFEKMKQEISEHGLEGIVHITHRDVYHGGFNVNGKSPKANCIFLDLPAPWDALHHLSRQRPAVSGTDGSSDDSSDEPWVSPLDPGQSVYICTFSPCIEQVTRTIDKMRELGWVNIEMVEVAHKKLHVTRDRIGLGIPADRGAFQAPSNVMESLSRLKAINTRQQEFFASVKKAENGDDLQLDDAAQADAEKAAIDDAEGPLPKPWMEGRLVHRPEAELKTHTSYLTFAILPREWSEEQEAEALARWPCGNETGVIGTLDKATRKNLKREMLNSGKKNKKKRG